MTPPRLAPGLILWFLIAGCGPATAPPHGSLELRFRLPAGATAGLAEVRLAPAWGGANRGEDRNDGYVRVALVAENFVLPTRGDRPVTVARGEIAPGAYAHVFVETPAVTGRRADGTVVAVTSHIEPIARSFELAPGGHVSIDIELIVLPRGQRFGGGFEIFVKDAVAAR